MNQPIADPEAIEDRISILDEIERDYHETLRAFVGHFRRNENPPQALVDLAEELLRRINHAPNLDSVKRQSSPSHWMQASQKPAGESWHFRAAQNLPDCPRPLYGFASAFQRHVSCAAKSAATIRIW